MGIIRLQSNSVDSGARGSPGGACLRMAVRRFARKPVDRGGDFRILRVRCPRLMGRSPECAAFRAVRALLELERRHTARVRSLRHASPPILENLARAAGTGLRIPGGERDAATARAR